jgi:hypothetical protein
MKLYKPIASKKKNEAVSKGQPFYFVDNQANSVDKILYKFDYQLIKIIIFVS